MSYGHGENFWSFGVGWTTVSSAGRFAAKGGGILFVGGDRVGGKEYYLR